MAPRKPLTLDPSLSAQVDVAVSHLSRSGVVAIPTDTLYGLAASAVDPKAVARVFEIKGRPGGMAMPVLLADPQDIDLYATDVSEVARELANRFWPGPLSLVVTRSEAIPDAATAGRDTVALRVPDHPVPREIARRLGAPITGTSANPSGQPAATTAAKVREQLGAAVDLVVDAGESPIGEGSTILDVTGPALIALRVGAVSIADISAATGMPVALP
jgi:L-threonylcarbamoyladenylate synthase